MQETAGMKGVSLLQGSDLEGGPADGKTQSLKIVFNSYDEMNRTIIASML